MMPAAAIRFFEGKHPRFTHVPPSVRFSVIAAVFPNSAALIAAANAVEPEPRITKSNRRASISCSLQTACWLPPPDGAPVEHEGADRLGAMLHTDSTSSTTTPPYVITFDP